MRVASEQSHEVAIAENDQAVAIVFDLMDPIRPGGNPGSRA